MNRSTSKPVKNTNKSISKRRLKIALLCDDSLDKQDGVQQYVLTLGHWLTQQGHEVHYLTSTTTRRDLSNLHVLSKNHPVKFNGNRLHIPLPASPHRIRTLLEDEQYDIIHVQMPYSPFMGGMVVHYAPSRTSVIGTFHIYPESHLVAIAAKGLGWLVSRQLKRFDTILSVSEAAQDFAQSSHGITSNIVPNMLDIQRFSVHPKKIEETEPVRVVFLGRLVERKGATHLLRAIEYLRTQQLTVRPFIVHIGGKGPLKPELEQYVKDYNLENTVSLDGFISETDKVEYLAQADIAVFPSTGGESFGISLIEAMASSPGVVLAGDNPGYRTVMDGRQLINPRDTDTFAHILARYISKRDDRIAAQVWQRQRVKKFDVSSVGTEIEKVYRSALRSRRS